MIEGQRIGEPNKSAAESPVEQVLQRLAETAHATAVFGQPIERGDNVVVPCAEVMVGMGFGMGSGLGPAGGPDHEVTGGGSGAGAGGGAQGRPVAAIIITREGVEVKPIVDVTKIVLASLTTSAFVLLWLGRLARGSRSGKDPSFKELKKAIQG